MPPSVIDTPANTWNSIKIPIQRFKYESVVVRMPNHTGNNSVAVEIRNGAEISLLAVSVLKFRYIS